MRLDVNEACKEALGEGILHLVTRDAGRKVRAVIVKAIAALNAGDVLTLDFTDAGIIDFSCADECLATLVSRLVSGEYGEKHLRLTGLSDSQRENIQVALERKKLPTLLVNADNSWDCLGTITPYLRETLQLIMSRRRLSARELANLLNLELTTSSTRLINLHRLRLVSRREHSMEEGGREFVYEGLLHPPADDDLSRGRHG